MTDDKKSIFQEILENIERIEYIEPDQIPGINLYMDQVTTFMEDNLSGSKRYPDDKVLTKTMINNYAKNNLLPPPEKKKYSKEHLIELILIYYFKNILSIKDIETLMSPLNERYFSSKDDYQMTDVYAEIIDLQKDRMDKVTKDLLRSFSDSFETFSDRPEEEQELLHKFSFICSLAFDVYVKKHVIEKLIDDMPEPSPKKKRK